MTLVVDLKPKEPVPESLFVHVSDQHGAEREWRFAYHEGSSIELPLSPGRYTIFVRDDDDREASKVVDVPSVDQAQTQSFAIVLRRPSKASKPDTSTPTPPPAPPPPPPSEHPPTAAEPPPPRAVPEPDEGLDVCKVFFATDRRINAEAERPEDRFGPVRSDSLSYGIAQVSFPPDHRRGHIERPAWWKFEFHVDPERHVAVRDVAVTPRDSFYVKLDDEIAGKPQKRLLIFVHGYRVDFQDALLRTGQLSCDVGYQGATMLFTWPSLGGLAGYTADEATSGWSMRHFEHVLEEVVQKTSVASIEIVAHSMGARIVANALDDLRNRPPGAPAIAVSQLVLAAPDMDAGEFSELASRIHGLTRRVTLYSSSKDKALNASHGIHHAPRAGEGGNRVLVLQGIDTIDASAVRTDFIGHSYVGDSESVVTDLCGVLGGMTVRQRCCLRNATKSSLPYWVFERGATGGNCSSP